MKFMERRASRPSTVELGADRRGRPSLHTSKHVRITPVPDLASNPLGKSAVLPFPGGRIIQTESSWGGTE
jgi:hypothetical protein